MNINQFEHAGASYNLMPEKMEIQLDSFPRSTKILVSKELILIETCAPQHVELIPREYGQMQIKIARKD